MSVFHFTVRIHFLSERKDAKEKNLWVVALLVALNIAVIEFKMCKGSEVQLSVAPSMSAEEISLGYRLAPMAASNLPYNMVGSLATSSSWSKALHLAKEQTDIIMELDGLVRAARDHSLFVNADYLDENPADYLAYAKRNDTRRSETLRHAQCMVRLGLLIEPQAAYLIQKRLTTLRQVHTLGDMSVQELLGMTKDQQRKLTKVWEKANSRQASLDLMATDMQEKKNNAAKMVTNNQSADVAAMKILTPAQHATWTRLIAERSLPTEPPKMPLPAPAEAVNNNLLDKSPLFHIATEKAGDLDFSEEQKKLLKTLQHVTQVGLHWVSLGREEGPFPPGDTRNNQADPVGQTQAEFVRQAEQVALLGILTERQAEQIQVTIAKTKR